MKKFFAYVVGSALGTFTFWVAIGAISNNTPSEVLRHAMGIVLADESSFDVPGAKIAISILQKSGLGLSADSYLGRITDFYSVVLQVALAAFVMFGLVSFLAIRWQSTQAAEEMIDEKLKVSLSSEDFNQKVSKKATEILDVAVEPIESQIRQLSTYAARLEAIEAKIAEAASAEEPDDENHERSE